MNDVVFSILIFVLGLIVGGVILLIVNSVKNKRTEKKADSVIDKAKKTLIK